MKTFRRAAIVILLIAIIAMVWYYFATRDRVTSRTITPDGAASVTLLSRPHTIDRLYPSMAGPNSQHDSIPLIEHPTNELLWLTGVRCDLVDANTQATISREFFCHSNLTLTEASRDASLTKDITPCGEARLFTLIPGRLSIHLPDGFGIPVLADERVDYFTMALNLNEQPSPVKLRFRTTIDSIRDSAAKAPMKALFRRAVYGYEPIGKSSPHTMCMGGDNPGTACGPFIATAASSAFHRSLGKTNTVHWLIPPGKFESHVDVSDQLDLPFDTTVHYVTGHLHPFGKSIQLIDTTEDKVIFEIHAKDFSDKCGVAEMQELSSLPGIPLHKSHHYELVTRYDNTTKQPIDAMSILYLYAHDLKFDESRSHSAGPLASR